MTDDEKQINSETPAEAAKAEPSASGSGGRESDSPFGGAVYYATAAFVVGVIAAEKFSFPTIPAAVIAVLSAVAERRVKTRRTIFIAAVSAAAFFVSIFLFNFNMNSYNRSDLRAYLESRSGQRRLEIVSGTVSEVDESAEEGAAFALDVTEIGVPGGKRIQTGGRVFARVYEGGLKPEWGETWELEGRLRTSDALSPPQRVFYRERGYTARMAVEAGGVQNKLGTAGRWSARMIAGAVRENFKKILTDRIAHPYDQILGRMLIGKSVKMDPALNDEFRAAGVIHIIVVAGLHVSFMLGIFVFMSFLWNRRPAINFAALSSVLILYYFVTGGGPSVTRATIMGLVFVIATSFGVEYKSGVSLCLSLLIMLVISPLMLFNAGLQLSFLACAGVVFIYPAADALIPPSAWRKWVFRPALLSLSAQLPLYPLLAYYFNQFCLIAPLSNILIVPLVALALPLTLATCLAGLIPGPLAAAPAFAAELTARGIYILVKFFAHLPFSNMPAASPPLWWTVVFLAGVVILINVLRAAWNGTDERITSGLLGLCAVGLALICSYFWQPPPRELRVTAVNVGEGDSILIEVPVREKGFGVFRMLVDGGGVWGPREKYGDPGEKAVGKYFRKNGIRSLDAVLLTHPDSDHMNGLRWVLNNIDTRAFLDAGIPADTLCAELGDRTACAERFQRQTPEEVKGGQEVRYGELLKIVKEKKIRYEMIREGARINLPSGVKISVLTPAEDMLMYNGLYRGKINNQAAVVKVSYGAGSAILTADAEIPALERLVRLYGGSLRADLYKVAHHGSRGAFSKNFLDAVSPSFAVISTGGPAHFGHPHKETLEGLIKNGVPYLRTDYSGTVSCSIPPSGGVTCDPEYDERDF